MWNSWHPQALGFLNTLLEGSIVDLLESGRVLTTLSVDVMRKHVVTVRDATDGWLGVGTAVGMEGRLSEVSRE